MLFLRGSQCETWYWQQVQKSIWRKKASQTKCLRERPLTYLNIRVIQGTHIQIKVRSAQSNLKQCQMLLIQLRVTGRCLLSHRNKFRWLKHCMCLPGEKTLTLMSALSLAIWVTPLLNHLITTLVITSSNSDGKTSKRTTSSIYLKSVLKPIALNQSLFQT